MNSDLEETAPIHVPGGRRKKTTQASGQDIESMLADIPLGRKFDSWKKKPSLFRSEKSTVAWGDVVDDDDDDEESMTSPGEADTYEFKGSPSSSLPGEASFFMNAAYQSLPDFGVMHRFHDRMQPPLAMAGSFGTAARDMSSELEIITENCQNATSSKDEDADANHSVYALVRRVQGGMLKGYRPVPIEDGLSTGGAVYLRDKQGQLAAVFKPQDGIGRGQEGAAVPGGDSSGAIDDVFTPGPAPAIFSDFSGGEAMFGCHHHDSPLSASVAHSLDLNGLGTKYPHSKVPRLVKQYSSNRANAASPTLMSRRNSGSFASPSGGVKHGAHPWESAPREFAAYLLDREVVPVTTLVRMQSDALDAASWQSGGMSWVVGSLQQYRKNNCTSEDVASSVLPVEGIHRIGVLDVRMFNTDRHEGNILLQTQKQENVELRRPSSDPNVLDGDGDMRSGSPYSTESADNAWDAANAKVNMVPIDHGYCLPGVLNLDEARFCWMEWSQSKEPFSAEMIEFIESLDGKADSELLRRECRMRESALLTLRVCTEFLQFCALQVGLSLHQIGTLMCRHEDCFAPSWLETIVMLAAPNDALATGTPDALDAFVQRFNELLAKSDPVAALSLYDVNE